MTLSPTLSQCETPARSKLLRGLIIAETLLLPPRLPQISHYAMEHRDKFIFALFAYRHSGCHFGLLRSTLQPRYCMRTEVLTAVKLSVLVVWVVTPCGLVGRYQCFGGTYCFRLQG
jgi:hypothetical protein